MKKLTFKTELVGAEEARAYLELRHPKMPPVKERVLEALRKTMGGCGRQPDGTVWMRPGTFGAPLKFDEEGRLIDGQHRLLVVAELGLVYPFVVMRGLEAA